jgi:hypothetical protein
VDGSWYQALLEQGADISGIRDSMIFGKGYAAVEEGI